MSADLNKRAAAARAVALVEPGMRLGLGTGSTAAHFLELLAARLGQGLRIAGGLATSSATERLARQLGIPLLDPTETAAVDLAVDGADEIDPDLNLIKGGGAALLREKIVAGAAQRFVVIADGSKRVRQLGRFPLPVEVTPFGTAITTTAIAAAAAAAECPGQRVVQRLGGDGQPIRTDGANLIFDLHAERIPDPAGLASRLDAVPGVMGHGLFIGMTATALVEG